MVLAQYLHRDRALARDHVRIVERMDEHEPALAREFDRVVIGLIVILAVQDDLAAEIRDGAHFDVRSRQRHHDHGIDAARARAERDALRVVARGRADHAARGRDRRQLRDFVVCTANFERKDRLEVFPLEIHAVLQSARQPRCVLERRFDRNVVNLGFQGSF